MKSFKSILFCYLFQLCLLQICKYVNHEFYLIALKKNTIEYQGLNKYDYHLILDANPFNENDNYHLVFSVSFPVNINIELSPEIIYKFFSLKKFCIKDLIEKSQENIVGKLIEYNSEIQILEKVWIKIIEVQLYQEMKDNDRRKIYYFLGENITRNNKKYLFLRKMNLIPGELYYQIARVSISNENEQLNDLNIGTEFSIQDASTYDFILREGITYDTYANDGTTMQNYKFEKVENLICLIYQGKTYLKKCFEDNQTKKEVTYL